MKKLLSLTLAFCLLLALAACGGAGEPEPTPEPAPEATAEPESTAEPDAGAEDPAAPDEALAAMVEEIYAACPVEFSPELLAMDAGLADEHAGLDEDMFALVDAGVLSLPMITGQAYNLTLLRLKDAADLETVGQALLDNAPVGYWICAAPSAVTVGGSGDLLCAVIADEELADADAMVEAFFAAAGSNDLLLETNEITAADMGLPDLSAPDSEPVLG